MKIERIIFPKVCYHVKGKTVINKNNFCYLHFEIHYLNLKYVGENEILNNFRNNYFKEITFLPRVGIWLSYSALPAGMLPLSSVGPPNEPYRTYLDPLLPSDGE